jgi:hypothetical protein
MATIPDSHPDSLPGSGPDVQPDSFEPGLGGAGTDARGEGESPYPPIEDTPPAEDQPMPPEDQPMPAESGGGSEFQGTAGTGGENRVQDSTFER